MRALALADPAAATVRVKADQALARARAGFQAWSRLTHSERRALLLRVKRRLYERREEFVERIHQEVGKPVFEALFHEVFPSLGHLDYFARRAAHALRPRKVRHRTLLHKRYRVHRVPRGVVAVLSPWNFPLLIPMGDLVPALAAGNAVVFKPSELCPRLGRAVASLFDELPEGAVTLLEGDGEVGAALVAAGPDAVAFTGSAATGRSVAALAARRLIPCTLELGGKNPVLVLDDADLDRAADAVTFAGFANAGQMCAAAGLVLVERRIEPEFVDKVVQRVRSLRPGAGPGSDWDVGPLLPARAIERVRVLVDEAVSAGATLACGGRVRRKRNRRWLEPTVLTGVRTGMRIATEETFGPVLPILTVAGEQEAVRIANESRYGLTAYVFSRSAVRARRVAEQLQVGTVVVNDGPHTVCESGVPWGGVKDSGLGRVHGESGLWRFTAEKVVSEPIFHLPGGELWNFPYSARKSRVARGFIRLRFGGTIWERLQGLRNLLGLQVGPREEEQ